MECVLSHYPSETHFNILTRVFNTEAKTLYEKRLHFSPIGEEEVRQLGYDQRYCGFEHTTSAEEIAAIKGKQISSKLQSRVAVHTPNQPAPLRADGRFFSTATQGSQTAGAEEYCGFKPGFLLGKRF